jgi:hypothetical protein
MAAPASRDRCPAGIRGFMDAGERYRQRTGAFVIGPRTAFGASRWNLLVSSYRDRFAARQLCFVCRALSFS